MHSRIVGAGIGVALTACTLAGLQPACAAHHDPRHHIRLHQAAGPITVRQKVKRADVPPPIFVGGQLVRQPAVLRHGHLLVPVRGVFEALHADVEYTAPRIVVVRRNGTVVAGLVVDRQHAVVYNQPRELSAAPVRRGGRVYVPLRAIAEIAGATVTYSARPRLVDIRVPNDELVVVTPPPEAPVAATEETTPLWVFGAVGAIVLMFAVECVRRIVALLRTGRGRRNRLQAGGLLAAPQIAYPAGLRDQHHIGEVGKQSGIDDTVNRA